jgi:hypothetical protein
MDNERRVKSRYPLELNVRYQTMGSAVPVAGIGHTLNISSNGMFVVCRSDVPEGTRLKVVVEWPSLLNGTTPLQLITVGAVVRRDQYGLSIAFESYQFRTMGRSQPSKVTQMPERLSPAYGGPGPRPLPLVAKSST